jgi:hypothetical protein
MHRRFAFLSGLALCGVLGGCTSSPSAAKPTSSPEASAPAPSARPSPIPPSVGTVTGYIDPCYGVGPMTQPYYSGTVIAVQGGNPVASEAVATGSAYRFYLVPGGYRLVAHNTPDRNNRWVDVTVVAGQITRQDIPNTCK